MTALKNKIQHIIFKIFKVSKAQANVPNVRMPRAEETKNLHMFI